MLKHTWKIISMAAMFLMISGWAVAGELEPPSGPAPTMKTLQEIYEKLEQIDDKLQPPLSPGSASIPRTGQTTSYGIRDDGWLQRGVAWPDPRFTDNDNGTVTDNLTGLVWLQNANCFGLRDWITALADANALAHGQCGLTDGSVALDWWLPNMRELYSLIDDSQYSPALSSGHPFTGVQTAYWSSTSVAESMDNSWAVKISIGAMAHADKRVGIYVWPVRAGQ